MSYIKSGPAKRNATTEDCDDDEEEYDDGYNDDYRDSDSFSVLHYGTDPPDDADEVEDEDPGEVPGEFLPLPFLWSSSGDALRQPSRNIPPREIFLARVNASDLEPLLVGRILRETGLFRGSFLTDITNSEAANLLPNWELVYRICLREERLH